MYHKNYLTTIVLIFFFGSIFMPSLGMMKENKTLTCYEITAESFLLLKVKYSPEEYNIKYNVKEKEAIYDGINFFSELDDLYGYEDYGDVSGVRDPNTKLQILYDLHTEQQKRIHKYFHSDNMVAAFNQKAYFETLDRHDKDHRKLKKSVIKALGGVGFGKEQYEKAFYKMEDHYANLKEEENLLRVPENLPQDLYELFPFLSRIKKQQLVPAEKQEPTRQANPPLKPIQQRTSTEPRPRQYGLYTIVAAATIIGIGIGLFLPFLYHRLFKLRPL